jgi:iron complex outermembrane receptor protein
MSGCNSGRARSALLFATLTICLIYGTAVSAQSANNVAAGSALEEIVVTAEKRSERLQDVPISAQVVTAQTLHEQNLNSLQDMAQTLPSVHINGTGSGGQLFIRGVGSGTSQSFDQSVGTFIDDIYHGRAHTSGGTFLDVDRIEILKGPQSTFFGNNAIAGALNVVTTKPTDTFGGWARLLYGQFGQYAAESAVNVPLNDVLAVRLAGTLNGLNGWQENPYAGEHQPKDDNQAGRISVLFRPSADFDALLKVEGSHNKDLSGSQIGDCPPSAPFVPAGFCKTAMTLGIPTGLNSKLNTTDEGQGVTLNTTEDVLTLNYRRWGQTFTSVTGFYDYHSVQSIDADGTPSQLLNLQIEERYHQFSQELRFASEAGQTIEYLAGAYFQMDHLNGHPTDLTYYFLTPTILGNAAFAPLVPYLPLAGGGTYVQNEHSYALFGSLGWNVTEQFKVSAGLRGSWVYKTNQANNFYGQSTEAWGGVVALPAKLQPLAAKILGATTAANGSLSNSDYIPSAKLQYKITPDVMAYFSYSNGFKAGVPTGGVVNGVAVPEILPENVDAYEVGIKSEWLDHRVLLNLDAFRSNYNNLQVTSAIFTPLGVPVIVTTNAASSRSQGLEFEGQWAVAENFRLSSALTYLDSHYVSYPNVTLTGIQTYCRAHPALAACAAQFPGGVPVLQDLSGRPTGFAPRVSGNLTASYIANLPREYRLTASASGIYSSSYYYANNGTDDDLLKQGGYGRLDSQLTLESRDRRWALDLIGKNLTDRIIVEGGTGGTSLPTSLGSTLLRKEQPRNFALQVRYHW